MIILQKLIWNNLFSYAKDNEIDFSNNQITQLLGKNGHGKSSIALILEEALFNKNSKGIKKADILNRYVKEKSYSIDLTFEQDGNTYEVKTVRGSTQTVTLMKNGDNISAHTATGTFKILESILGIDHKTFAQLVYQSSSSSLEFLTATDTNRKKFLIDLLDLNRYVEAFEIFKAIGKEVEASVTVLDSKVKTTQAWLDKHLKESLEQMSLEGYPVYEDSPEAETINLSAQLAKIDSINKKINKNELLKKQLDAISLEDLTKHVDEEDISSEIAEVGAFQKTIKDASVFITSNIKKVMDTCPTCGHPIDSSKLKELITEQENLKKSAEEAIKRIESIVLVKKSKNAEAKRLATTKETWESLHNSIDPTLQTDVLNPDELSSKLKVLEKEIRRRKQELEELEKYNQKASANNARVQLITSQMDEMKSSIGVYSLELNELTDKLSLIQILQKTFSTSGLIAYKIECMVKDLEDLTNEYLAELSSGRFQLSFKVTASDKLNVIISDNGRDIDILALSGGERARVNTATLLAIRKLMQSLSSTRINLLILDETIDSLDIEGKEKLIEVLLNEEHLNTILVSHGYTHPLLEKITVVKENNISRLE